MMMDTSKDKYGGPERRRYPRLRGSLVEYSTVGEDSSKKTSFTENISPIGICFLVDEEVKVDTLLSLKIYLPGIKEAIEAKGRVVWTAESCFLTKEKKKHYDLGVELIEIEEIDRLRICEYILTHINKPQDFNDF